jgi:ABC-2 type transport system ATP-binding protein
LDFRARLHGMSTEDRTKAIRRVIDRCWLGEFIDRPIGQLSKGMRQRVGLADALIHDPKVLVLDEPTIGLDPTQIRETRQLIKELGERHTILLSSHILHEVEQLCSRAIIIKAGKIVASGAPDELRQRVSASSPLIAEIQGPADEVKKEVAALAGVGSLKAHHADGWNRLAVTPAGGADVRTDIFKLATQKGWSLREIRREIASLEDYFVKIVAEQETPVV